MAGDGQWHEVSGERVAEHSAAEVFAVLNAMGRAR